MAVSRSIFLFHARAGEGIPCRGTDVRAPDYAKGDRKRQGSFYYCHNPSPFPFPIFSYKEYKHIILKRSNG